MRRLVKIRYLLVVVVLAGCVGHPYPPPSAPSSRPAVVLFGDSLSAQAFPLLAPSLAWHQVSAPAVNAAVVGSGPLDADYPTRSAVVLDAAPAGSVVVIQFSGNCLHGPGGGCPHPPGTDAFYHAWRLALGQTVLDARERGLVPLLVLSPRMGAAVGPHAIVVDWLRVVNLIVASEHGVPTVDWCHPACDTSGAYQQFLWYADVFQPQAWHLVRAGDQAHLDGEGPRRAASWTAWAVAGLD